MGSRQSGQVFRVDEYKVAKPRQQNEIRIIGGEWRGRRISFLDHQGLRPTGDRIRETLFNWLQHRISGASCLDLFAGSGALGLEAASRGAERCVLVEKDRRVAARLQENINLLGAKQVSLQNISAENYLASVPSAFDLLFIDPPFTGTNYVDLIANIARSGCLAPKSLIYLETDKRQIIEQLPEAWRLDKEKRAGEIHYRLYEHT